MDRVLASGTKGSWVWFWSKAHTSVAESSLNLSPGQGACRKQPIDVLLSHWYFSLSFPLSKKSMEKYSGVRIKGKKSENSGAIVNLYCTHPLSNSFQIRKREKVLQFSKGRKAMERLTTPTFLPPLWAQRWARGHGPARVRQKKKKVAKDKPYEAVTCLLISAIDYELMRVKNKIICILFSAFIPHHYL